MVVLKRIYEPSKYHDDMAYADVVSYILNPEKTCLQLIGGFAVNPKYAAREMLALTKAAGKDFEVRLHHFVVSFGRSDVSNPYLAHQIGTRIADFFADDYQLLFAVHTNRPNIHIHFVMNAVSYQTGKKYAGSRKDFYSLTNYVHRVLRVFKIKSPLRTDYGVDTGREY